ncbi:MAG: methylenetetrahydrofolate reductase [NAD(P)H] [Verrucomicrobia bacterium]|nr:methylenetetrahydrofolate reductase [NAD(P)H] [Verrucomicrobiota bacterium]
MIQTVRDLYQVSGPSGNPVISVEFFPPKTEEGEKTLIEKTAPAFKAAGARFASVTYGAGGSTREKTLSLVDRLQRLHDFTTVAHLTCVNHTAEEIRAIIEQARALGIRNLLALRGDPPGGGAFLKTPGGFEYASELVAFIRRQGDFSIGVAGFPEGHVACTEGREADWRHLKGKVDAGADFVLTQLFFDNADFLRFRDFVTRLGVSVPVVPGILPVLNGPQIKRFASLCGAKLPPPMVETLDGLAGDEEGSLEFGIDFAARQCAELLREGVPGIHFYTLNKARSVVSVLRQLGLTPA